MGRSGLFILTCALSAVPGSVLAGSCQDGRQWVFAARVAGAKAMGDGAALAIRELLASLPAARR